jgi:hypothetical protein
VLEFVDLINIRMLNYIIKRESFQNLTLRHILQDVSEVLLNFECIYIYIYIYIYIHIYTHIY